MAEGPHNPAGSSGSCCWESSAAGRGRWPTPLALVAVMKRLRSAFKCSRAGRAAERGQLPLASRAGGCPARRHRADRKAAQRHRGAPPLPLCATLSRAGRDAAPRAGGAGRGLGANRRGPPPPPELCPRRAPGSGPGPGQ